MLSESIDEVGGRESADRRAGLGGQLHMANRHGRGKPLARSVLIASLMLASFVAAIPASAQVDETYTPISRAVAGLTGPGREILACTIEQLTRADGTQAHRSVVTADHVAVPFGIGDGRRCISELGDSYVAFDAEGNMYFSYWMDNNAGYGLASVGIAGNLRWANDYGQTWPLNITVGGDGLLYTAMWQADIAAVLDPSTGAFLTSGFENVDFGTFDLIEPSTTGAAVADTSGPRYLDLDEANGTIDVASWPAAGPVSIGSFGPDDSFAQVTNRRTPNGTEQLCQQTVVKYDRIGGQVWAAPVEAPYESCHAWFAHATADGGLVGYTARRTNQPPIIREWYFFRVDSSGAVTQSGTYNPQDDVAVEPGNLQAVDEYGNLISMRGRQRSCTVNGQLVRCDILRVVVFGADGQISEHDLVLPEPLIFNPLGFAVTPGLLTMGGSDINRLVNTSTPNTRQLGISFLGDDYRNVRYYQLVGRAGPPSPAPLRMFAMGDSYSSGEGLIEQTSSYECGTDLHRGRYYENTTLTYMSLRRYEIARAQDPTIEFEPGCDTVTESSLVRGDVAGRLLGVPYKNLCHRSAKAYPSLLSDRLQVADDDFGFSACSGARFRDFFVSGQYPRSPEGVSEDDPSIDGVGGQSQISALRRFVEANDGVDLVTIGLGGNDVSFKDVLLECIERDCARPSYREEIDRNIEILYSSLWRALAEIRETAGPNADVVVFGYPIVVDPGDWCLPLSPEGLRVSEEERMWIAGELIPALNTTLQDSATAAGVHFIDISHSIEGHEICSSDGGYINDIRFGDDIGGAIANESFHPNEQGHEAIAEYAWPQLHMIVSNGDGNPEPARCNGQLPTVFGTRGSNGDDVILGRSLDDTITGRAGNDLICAGAGNDQVSGGTGNDTVFGQQGSDTLFGGTGDDVIDGGPHDDVIRGGGGSDSVDGGDGDDELFGNGGRDALSGGTGIDSCDGGGGRQDTADPSCETATRVP